jgi:predicted nucleic acid-binding protein
VKVALDTNALVYAEGINGAERRDAALDLVRRLPQEMTDIPIQAPGDVFNVLVRRAGKPRPETRDALPLAGAMCLALSKHRPA